MWFYVALCQILSRNDENRDNLALITWYLGSHFYQKISCNIVCKWWGDTHKSKYLSNRP